VPGALAGTTAVLLTALLDESPWMSWGTAPALLGAAAIILIGFAVGRTRDLQSRADTEIAQRRRVEDDLQEREVRLAVNSEIARAMRDGEPTDRIIQIVVDGLYTHFPQLRAAYSTVAVDGRITVARSVGAAELPPLGSTSVQLPAQALETLSEVDLIATTIPPRRQERGPLGRPRSRWRSGGARRAGPTLGVAGRTPLARLGTPRQWSAHERTTVREAADFLAVALRNAEATTRLEDSERRFRRVAESSQAVMVLDQKEGAVYLNPECARLSGYTLDELQRTSLWAISIPMTCR